MFVFTRRTFGSITRFSRIISYEMKFGPLSTSKAPIKNPFGQDFENFF